MAIQYPPEFNATNVAAGTATTTPATTSSTNGKSYLVLKGIVINTKGASSNTLTVYDSATAAGTKIATIDTTSSIGLIAFDAICTTGITCVSATGTGADYTILWRRNTA